MNHSKRFLFISSLVAVVMFLTACSSDTRPDPEITSTPEPPTQAAGQMTVADVLALANPPWLDVNAMRTTSQAGPTPREGEDAPFTGSVQDWTAKGDRHLVEFQNGTAINEQIWADGTVYMRGQFVSSAVAPGIDVDTWVILDPSVVPDESPVGVQIRYVVRPQDNPYGPVTDDMLVRPVTEQGTATVGKRNCTVYVFGDESNTGTEIRYEIAVDDIGLPCQLIQRAGDFQNSTVYEFDLDILIEAPLEGTPVSGTPEG